MQKKILLVVVYFTLTAVCVNAQNKKHIPPPAPAAPQSSIENLLDPPPPPPLPPIPAVPSLPPVPPAPPAPPALPAKELTEKKAIPEYIKCISPVIINSNGYEVRLQKIKETTMICLKKNAVSQMIRLSTWNAGRKYFEKKYGQLPLAAQAAV